MNPKSKMTRLITLTALFILTNACASRSLTPDVSELKVSRENPSSKCEEIGHVSGTTMTSHGTSDEALNDMKKEATAKGATYLRVDQYSATGSSVSGTAYKCL